MSDQGLEETVQAAVMAAAASEAEGAAAEDSAGAEDQGAAIKFENDAAGNAEGEAAAPAAKRRRTGGGRKPTRPWNDMLFELLKYRQVNGNVMVPFKSGGELGKWVASQRAQYLALQKQLAGEDSKKLTQQDGPERLTEERMKVLTSIGFVWDVVQADNDARWKKRFEELKEYRAIHGHVSGGKRMVDKTEARGFENFVLYFSFLPINSFITVFV